MHFERATEGDKEYFRRLNRACYEDVVSTQFGPWDEERQNNSFETKWRENNFRKVVVDDVLIGGVWIDEHPDRIQLREVQVHPDFQGGGTGTLIVQSVIEHARSKGKPVQLRVLFKNRAVNLYKRLGFQIIGKNEHQYIMECT